MTELEKAYVAGFIDGEGCVSFATRKVKQVTYITPTVQIANTNRSVLQWIAELYDVNVYDRIEDPRPTRKKVYRVVVCGEIARQMLKDVYPYLKVKREQAKIILGQNITKVKKSRKTGRLIRSITPTIEKDNRERLAKVRLLNKRGRNVA